MATLTNAANCHQSSGPGVVGQRVVGSGQASAFTSVTSSNSSSSANNYRHPPSPPPPPVPSRPKDDVIQSIPEGRVGQVCKEWLIREDGNLAYRLQNEEITHHYSENRSKNRIVREDLPLAMQLQKSELLEAKQKRIRSQLDSYLQARGNGSGASSSTTSTTPSTSIHQDHGDEDRVPPFEPTSYEDEQIAKQIEQRLRLQDEQARRELEQADEELARKLIEKERTRQMRKRLQKEKQQVQRLSALIGVGGEHDVSLGEGPSGEPSGQHSRLPQQLYRDANGRFDTIGFTTSSYQRILLENEQEVDLSEFCAPPPPGLSPHELKAFFEEQDAEIARFLQQQELAQSKQKAEKEKLALIEAQDREIAKVLQQQEKERARRLRDKARQQKLAQQHQNSRGNPLDNDSNVDFQMDLNSHEADVNYQRTSTPISPQNSFEEQQQQQSQAAPSTESGHPSLVEHDYDIPENHLLRMQENVQGQHQSTSVDSDHDSITYEEPYQLLARVVPNCVPRQVATESPLPPPPPAQPNSFYNIACDLDPTYQRRVSASSSSHTNSPQSHLSSASSSSNGNLLESCVDEDANEVQGLLSSKASRSHDSVAPAVQATISPSSSPPPPFRKFRNSPHPGNLLASRGAGAGAAHSTTSSRSSHSSSSSSHRSKSSHQLNMIGDGHAGTPPPLPPREGSLAPVGSNGGAGGSASSSRPLLPPRLVNDSVNHPYLVSSNCTTGPLPPTILPPHHPQHPNRKYYYEDISPSSPPPPNHRSSLYLPNNVSPLATGNHHSSATAGSSSSSYMVQGHRRALSMEKQKKGKRDKSGQDGCKTQ